METQGDITTLNERIAEQAKIVAEYRAMLQASERALFALIQHRDVLQCQEDMRPRDQHIRLAA